MKNLFLRQLLIYGVPIIIIVALLILLYKNRDKFDLFNLGDTLFGDGGSWNTSGKTEKEVKQYLYEANGTDLTIYGLKPGIDANDVTYKYPKKIPPIGTEFRFGKKLIDEGYSDNVTLTIEGYSWGIYQGSDTTAYLVYKYQGGYMRYDYVVLV